MISDYPNSSGIITLSVRSWVTTLEVASKYFMVLYIIACILRHVDTGCFAFLGCTSHGVGFRKEIVSLVDKGFSCRTMV